MDSSLAGFGISTSCSSSNSSSNSSSSNSSSNNRSNNRSSTSSSIRESTGDLDLGESTLVSEEEEEAVDHVIPEPILCCEAGQGKVPQALKMLLRTAECRSTSDCLLVAAHLLLLECGCLPQGGEIRTGKMPIGWRAQEGVYRLCYTHTDFENSQVLVTAVLMVQMLIFNVILKMSREIKGSWKLDLKPSVYVKEEWRGGNSAAIYRDLPKLSCVFKDQLVRPLIATAREVLFLPDLLNLPTLPHKLLLIVLRQLDVQSVLSLSSVCSRLHYATQDPMLWRHLVFRDFQDNTDWKEVIDAHPRFLNSCKFKTDEVDFDSKHGAISLPFSYINTNVK